MVRSIAVLSFHHLPTIFRFGYWESLFASQLFRAVERILFSICLCVGGRFKQCTLSLEKLQAREYSHCDIVSTLSVNQNITYPNFIFTFYTSFYTHLEFLRFIDKKLTPSDNDRILRRRNQWCKWLSRTGHRLNLGMVAQAVFKFSWICHTPSPFNILHFLVH